MTKALSDMTLEELWDRFPIDLTPHQDVWADWYDQERRALEVLVGAYRIARISHIGSTAIPGILAKPIVDILMEACPKDFESVARDIDASGQWICMSRTSGRISYNKGYTTDGYAARVFHLHLRRNGDCKEIVFRDYLMRHPDIAREYERLKARLLAQYRPNRDAYTAAKSPFIETILRKAVEER